MCDQKSLVKARYATAVLRIARCSEKHTAADLVEGLMTESPDSDDRPDVARAHRKAIESFGTLADNIRSQSGGRSIHWDAAFAAMDRWRLCLGA